MVNRILSTLAILVLVLTSSTVLALDPPNPDTPPPTDAFGGLFESRTALDVAAGGTIGLLKYLPDDVQVTISGKVVTGVFQQGGENVLYLEETDRSAGIRVTIPQGAPSLTIGRVVNAAGTLDTVNGERVLSAQTITDCELNSPIDPLLIALANIGGGTAGYQPRITLRAPVPSCVGLNGVGINNVGILVKVYGRVTHVVNNGTWSGTYFYVDDGSDVYECTEYAPYIDSGVGSDVWDGTSHMCSEITHKNLGVRVAAVSQNGTPVAPVSEGDLVGVVGIVGTRVGGDSRVLPILRPRSGSDITDDPDAELVSTTPYADRMCRETGETPVWSLVSPPLPIDLTATDQWPPAADVIFCSCSYLWSWTSKAQAGIWLDCEHTLSPEVNSVGPWSGYWVRQKYNDNLMYMAIDDDYTDRWVSLPGTDLIMFGYPLNHEVAWRDLFVTDGKAALPIENASSNAYAWIDPTGYWWDCSQQEPKSIGMTAQDDSTVLQTWRGYYAFTNKPVALIVPGTTLATTGRGAISTTVTNASSQPIAGARVYCKYASALTDPNGVAGVGVQQPSGEHALPPGAYLVTASAAGYQSKSVLVTVTTGTLSTVTVQLQSQSGVIVDVTASPTSVMADGLCTSEVRVYVTDLEGGQSADRTVALSTTLGTFSNSSSTISLTTGADGTARCILKSSSTGVAIITATCESVSDQATVEFTTPTYSAVATPTLDLPAGTYCSERQVHISCATEGASIYYTVDIEGDPTDQDIPYDSEGGVVVPHSLTVRARAFKAGCVPSSTATAQYTIDRSANCYSNRWDDYSAFWIDNEPALPVSCIAVSEITPGVEQLGPGTVKIKWSGGGWANEEKYKVLRNDVVIAPEVYDTEYVDTACPLVPGETYTYKVQRLSGEGNEHPTGLDWVPGPGEGVYRHVEWTAGALAELPVKIVRVPASQNQTVDSRVDPRCEGSEDDNRLNFRFGDRTYRGGLFVGTTVQPDGSQTARSYLQFDFTNHMPPAGDSVMDVRLCAYCTGKLYQTWPEIGTHLVTNDIWDEDTLDWDSSLALLPKVLPTAAHSQYISSEDPTWYAWPAEQDNTTNSIYVDAVNEMKGDGVLSMALTQEVEMQGDWTYFAKRQYDANLGPAIVYASGPEPPIWSFSISPNPVRSGQVATGTVTLLDPAPAGGVCVYINCLEDETVAPVYTVIPQGETVGTFPISTHPVGTATPVTIRVSTCARHIDQSLTLSPWNAQ